MITKWIYKGAHFVSQRDRREETGLGDRHSYRDTSPPIALFTTAFLILLAAAAWAGLIASEFLFGYLWFLWIQ